MTVELGKIARPGVHAVASSIEELACAPKSERSAPTSNVAVLRAFVGAIGLNDMEAMASHLHPNVTVTIHSGLPVIPLKLKASGIADVVELIRANFLTVEDQKPQSMNVVESGDSVYVVVEESGKVCGTDVCYEACGYQHYRFVEGRIVSFVQILAPRTP